jgi:hypothetical protein
MTAGRRPIGPPSRVSSRHPRGANLGTGTSREVDAKTTELIRTSGGETKTTRVRRVLGNWKITTI